MAAVHNLDIRVPEALSVVSFDDFELSVMVRPKLTTIRQPLEEMANAACDLLYRRIHGRLFGFSEKDPLKDTVHLQGFCENIHQRRRG